MHITVLYVYFHLFLFLINYPTCSTYYIEGCQFSDFSLISDFLRIGETGIKLIKYGQNIDQISIVSNYRLDSGNGLDKPSLNTVSKQ